MMLLMAKKTYFCTIWALIYTQYLVKLGRNVCFALALSCVPAHYTLDITVIEHYPCPYILQYKLCKLK